VRVHNGEYSYVYEYLCVFQKKDIYSRYLMTAL
jgi:hypothetical protein